MTAKQILIVDDDRETCRLIAELVGAPDRTIAEAVSARDALDHIRQQSFDLVISDINLNAAESGHDILKEMKSAHPAGQVVLISAFGTLETAVAAVRITVTVGCSRSGCVRARYSTESIIDWRSVFFR